MGYGGSELAQGRQLLGLNDHLFQGELERAAGIIRNMLDFYRPIGSERIAVDINGLVVQVLQLLRAECSHREITAEAQLEPLLPAVLAAPDQIKQVLLNLVLNALEAMPGGGMLTLRTRLAEAPESDTPPQVSIEVSDSGTGIPAHMLNQIFEAFVTTRSKGNGLGLAVCRTIVRDHSGSISAANLATGGACFTIVLPAIPPD